MAGNEGLVDAYKLNQIEGALQEGGGAMPSASDRHMPDWYMDLKEDLEKLRHYLRSEVYNPLDKKHPWKSIGTPLMNEKGIGMYVGYIELAAVNKNLIMCKINDDNLANRICRDACHDCNMFLIAHRQEFECDSKDIPLLNSMMRQLIRASVLRALGGGERMRVASTYQRSEQFNGGMPMRPRQRGFLDGLLGFGGQQEDDGVG